MNAQETTAALLWLTHSWEVAPPGYPHCCTFVVALRTSSAS
jgi:hypothetical protein